MICEELFCRGKRTDSERRYRLEMSLGYAVPVLITLVTAIVEFSADKCNIARPRFAEEECFFAGNTHPP